MATQFGLKYKHEIFLYTFLKTDMFTCVYYQVCALVQLVGSRYKSYKQDILIKTRLKCELDN